MELEHLREEIRAVDEEMAALFVRRMETARKIAAYKRAHELPVEDRAQEARVLAGRGALVEDALRPYYLEFLRSTRLMTLCCGAAVSRRPERCWTLTAGC